ncbi:unnamed protein product [Bursaphelenchus xylophilus]|uniref:Trans-1,2-dihydrobenzene-1,2-diol dehydrogenase n=1 Tax=Bursaphelenchus xylophilus TaxID=6326 RepID=A0A1I7S4S4_BURXY|nr:unnamed protein product [Bursaphelenchus xylophilus]CAG9117340.1 unnamed protein product [Bursaphelenchus xylophilus]
MSESEALRWGILGCGNISGDFVKAFTNTKKPHTLVAIAAMGGIEKAEAFIEENKVPEAKPCGDYQDVLDNEDIEIVYIGTQTFWHYEWAIKSLEAGKHVIVETPIAVTAKQAEELAEKAKEVGKFLMEGFWSRFFPAYVEIKRLCETEDFGKPKFVNCNLGFPIAEPTPSNGRTIMSTIGCYCVNLAQFVFGGEAEEVKAVGELDPEHDNAEKWATINIKFGDDKNAIIHTDSRVFLPNSAYVTFENGYVEIPEWMHAPTKLKYYQMGGDDGYGEHAQKEFRLDDRRKFVYPNSTGFRYEQDHIYECVKNGDLESPVMSLADSIAIRKVIDEARDQIGVPQPDV